MSSNNIFPLEEIVHIDPDHCKSLMPEWKGYVEADSLNAGGLCHKESGFIQELCEKVSLICRQNTWIDGSLADHGWWSQWINTCREKFPWYRIAIFYIYCELPGASRIVKLQPALMGLPRRAHSEGIFFLYAHFVMK